jgi:ferredoxin
MQTRYLEIQKLDALAKACSDNNQELVVPVKDGKDVRFQNFDQTKTVEFGFVNAKNSIKNWFFPSCEKILEYKREEKMQAKSAEMPDTTTVLLGCKPCDAASLPILDKVFGWDYDDLFFQKRRENNVVITQACVKSDETCFCTSVNCSPTDESGSDIMLYVSDDKLYFKPVTEKGDKWLNLDCFSNADVPEAEVKKAEENKPEKRFELDKIKPFLDGSFEKVDFWKEVSMRCIGCGACTYTCPTCHCFDIVDEGGTMEGSRLKCWDSCSFGLFTLHTSGHNPRGDQYERWRQRINHKFKYYVDKFEKTLCTGCGRCVRHCPVSMGVLETLMEINEG